MTKLKNLNISFDEDQYKKLKKAKEKGKFESWRAFFMSLVNKKKKEVEKKE